MRTKSLTICIYYSLKFHREKIKYCSFKTIKTDQLFFTLSSRTEHTLYVECVVIFAGYAQTAHSYKLQCKQLLVLDQ